ncbi:ribonuclease H protein [Tanacetum coccineum]
MLLRVLTHHGFGKAYFKDGTFFFVVPYQDDFYIRKPRGPFASNALVSDFITNGEWDLSKLQFCVHPEEVKFISQIPIFSTSLDKIVWHYEPNGNYNVKSDNISGLIVSRVQQLLDMVPSNSERIKFHTSLANIAWQIWKSRNAYVFSDVRPCPSSTISSACRLALTYGWQNAIVESDCKAAISLASSDVDPPWSLYAIVADIRIWASQLALSFSWVKRECNLASHLVAKIACRSHENFLWDDNFPDVITSVARSDII